MPLEEAATITETTSSFSGHVQTLHTNFALLAANRDVVEISSLCCGSPLRKASLGGAFQGESRCWECGQFTGLQSTASAWLWGTEHEQLTDLLSLHWPPLSITVEVSMLVDALAEARARVGAPQ